jgi:uncharacterized repeat protein (TIGR03803 family)
MKALVMALCAGAVGALLSSTIPLQAATEKVIYSFCSQPNCTDGEYPWAGVLRLKDELFTTATIGGPDGRNTGSLNKVDRKPGGTSVVYSPNGAWTPASTLIDVNGTIYGTSLSGGSGDGGNGGGTIYSVNRRTGNAKILYSFCSQTNCTDGAVPSGSLIDVNGVLYGTTSVGGGNTVGCYGPYPGCGTVFSFNPATGVEKVLYAFCAESSCADGSRPSGSLLHLSGMLYGTTIEGGAGADNCSDMDLGCGVVFALDPKTRTETVLHAFAGGSDGNAPEAGLLNVRGTLYGTTQYGGATNSCGTGYGCGTVFSIDPATGAETILHAFLDDGTDGFHSTSPLVEMNGFLYGTTREGGSHAGGTVFSLGLRNGKEKVVYAFCRLQRCNDGGGPYAGLTAAHGKLYGTTEGGGTGDPNFSVGGGTIFVIKP